MSTGWLHAITIICHTIILMAIIIAAVILAEHQRLDGASLAFLSTLGGITGSGLVINGRKTPTIPENSHGQQT